MQETENTYTALSILSMWYRPGQTHVSNPSFVASELEMSSALPFSTKLAMFLNLDNYQKKESFTFYINPSLRQSYCQRSIGIENVRRNLRIVYR